MDIGIGKPFNTKGSKSMHVYDKEIYRHSIVPEIKKWRAARPDEPIEKAISNLVHATTCPIIVMCEFFQELEPSPKVDEMLYRLRRFYNNG